MCCNLPYMAPRAKPFTNHFLNSWDIPSWVHLVLSPRWDSTELRGLWRFRSTERQGLRCWSLSRWANITVIEGTETNSQTWKAKCPICMAIVAGFRGKVALKNRTLGVPGRWNCIFIVEKLLFNAKPADSANVQPAVSAQKTPVDREIVSC